MNILRTALIILAIIAIGIWGVQYVASDDGETTSAPSEVVPQSMALPSATAEPTSTQPVPTRTPQPTEEPTETPEPTSAPTEEPTEEPEEVATERPAPPPTGLEGEALVIDRGESGRLEIALTFDAGDGPGHTAEILDMLADYGIKGSFGITGEWAEENPDLVLRMVNEGHMIINHSYSHQSFSGFSMDSVPLTAQEQEDEIFQTRQIILEISNYETVPYFRYPYNDYNLASLEHMSAIGFDYIAGYTCDSKAWMGHMAAEIVAECGVEAEDGGPGAVVLMHVVYDEDYLALPVIVDEYLAAGYDFVTFEQIIQP